MIKRLSRALMFIAVLVGVVGVAPGSPAVAAPSAKPALLTMVPGKRLPAASLVSFWPSIHMTIPAGGGWQGDDKTVKLAFELVAAPAELLTIKL